MLTTRVTGFVLSTVAGGFDLSMHQNHKAL